MLDDWHTAMAMVLLRQGITDINTSSEADLKMVGEQLSAMVKATSPKVTITAYSDLPAGQLGIAQMWSGDIINAQNYLPEGTGPEILRYWFPSDGKGMVDNDMFVTLKGGKNPVLAHLFINHMLDPEVAKQNFSAIGYQPPQNSITADSLVNEQFIPENLRTVIVKPEYFDTGYRHARTRRGQRCGLAQRVADVQGRRVVDADVAVPVIAAPSQKASPRRERASGIWAALAAPGIVWLLLCFVFPLYVVLCIVFGQVDPMFRTPIPVWNPLQWNPSQFNYVLTHIVGADGIFGPALVRTAVFVFAASSLCLLIAFPVAYYVARLSGRRKGLLLALLIAPFWISYMMRMFAWVNLLQNDGIVNKVLSFGGLFNVNIDWLTGQPVVVILGLVYGYVPYMILPLYAGLDRLSQPMLEASRDLGADRFSSFWRVTLPLCRPTILAAVLLTCLPMLGDYFTSDMLSASPKTAMVGNLINDSVHAPGRTGQAGAFVMLVFLVALLPMLYYIRVTSRRDEVAS